MQWKKPDVGAVYPIQRPQVSDEFDAEKLGLQWQWNHNPLPDKWSLTARPGWLRLTASPADSLATARNTLTQKIWDDSGVVDVKMDASAIGEGGRAGFTFVSGSNFDWVGVKRENGALRFAWEGGEGPAAREVVYLRGIHDGANATLWYSTDGTTYADTGVKATLKFLNWKGARVGMFSFGPDGAADFDYFHYQYSTRK
jgi:beta-xylosidase